MEQMNFRGSAQARCAGVMATVSDKRTNAISTLFVGQPWWRGAGPGRGGGQSQFSALLKMGARSDRVQLALTYASENLASDMSVERLRVEAARLMMETTRHPIEIVARETGLGDRERMRQAFLRAFGQPPQTIQRASAITPLAL